MGMIKSLVSAVAFVTAALALGLLIAPESFKWLTLDLSMLTGISVLALATYTLFGD